MLPCSELLFLFEEIVSPQAYINTIIFEAFVLEFVIALLTSHRLADCRAHAKDDGIE